MTSWSAWQSARKPNQASSTVPQANNKPSLTVRVFKGRLSANQLIFGGCAVWSLLLISCETAGRIEVAPGTGTPGASYVGSKACAQCHSEVTEHFAGSTHSRLKLTGDKVGSTSCEGCHGPGSLHVQSGGHAGTIVNPRKSPEACF